MKSLIVKNNIRINASVTRVWEVLTKPEYIRKWDELPENFGDFQIHPTAVIEWPGDSILRVTELAINEKLKYALYVPSWNDESITDIGYTYTLSVDNDGHTWLGIEIGDFAILSEGSKYYDASITFGETASQKIKALAEKRQIAL